MSPTTDVPLALVTGASTNVGRAVAQQLIARGVDLVMTAAQAAVRRWSRTSWTAGDDVAHAVSSKVG